MLSVVTCYYNTPTRKHSRDEYMEWLDNFLYPFSIENERNGIISLILFTSKSERPLFEKYLNCSRFKVIELEYYDLYTYRYIEQWRTEQYTLDPEKSIHVPELYMIWNEKFKFVERAIEYNFFDAELYVWMDIGMVRDTRLRSLLIQRLGKPSVDEIDETKIHMLRISDNLVPFNSMDEYGISLVNKKEHLLYSVAGGFIYGHKTVLLRVIPKFYELLDLYIQKKIFAGKDQNIYANLICKYPEFFCFIEPDSKSNWTTVYQPNRWFYGLNFLFSSRLHVICCPNLKGGLGNRLFQVASVYGIARRNNGLCVLNGLYAEGNAHSSVNYLNTVFKNFILDSKPMESYLCAESIFEPSQILLNIPRNTSTPYPKRYVIGEYLQCLDYFHDYRDEILALFNFPKPSNFKKDCVFVHLRYGDYVKHPLHYVDLGVYYTKAIRWFQQINPEVHFRIFSNDMYRSRCFCKTIQLKNVSYDESVDEIQSLSDMSNCKLGGICANSTFSWWAGYLNPNPNAIIYLPTKWFSDEFHKYSSDIRSSKTSSGMIWKNVKMFS